MDKPKVVAAAPHKLARLTYGTLAAAHREERCRQRVLHNFDRRAQQPGMTRAPTAPAAHAT